MNYSDLHIVLHKEFSWALFGCVASFWSLKGPVSIHFQLKYDSDVDSVFQSVECACRWRDRVGKTHWKCSGRGKMRMVVGSGFGMWPKMTCRNATKQQSRNFIVQNNMQITVYTNYITKQSPVCLLSVATRACQHWHTWSWWRQACLARCALMVPVGVNMSHQE